MTPIVDGIEAAYGSQLIIKRIEANSGHGPEVMRQYRIPGHPTTLIFDRTGHETHRFIGPQTKALLDETLQAVLK